MSNVHAFAVFVFVCQGVTLSLAATVVRRFPLSVVPGGADAGTALSREEEWVMVGAV